MDPALRIWVHCERCGAYRGVGRLEMRDKFGDVPLREIEPRLKCSDRGRFQKGRVCGGKGRIELHQPEVLEVAGDHWAEPPR